jgi:hypothetical protein
VLSQTPPAIDEALNICREELDIDVRGSDDASR